MQLAASGIGWSLLHDHARERNAAAFTIRTAAIAIEALVFPWVLAAVGRRKDINGCAGIDVV